MSQFKVWLGSTGPFYYDDAVDYPGETGALQRAIRVEDAGSAVNGSMIVGIDRTDVGGSGVSIVAKGTIALVTDSANSSPVASLSAVSGNYVAISSGRSGTGNFLPLTFFTNATERMRIAVDGSISFGTGAIGISGNSINAVFNDDEIVSNNDEMMFVS